MAPGTNIRGLEWCSDLRWPDPEPDSGLSDDPLVAAEQQERARWGLPSDEASTRAAMEAPDSSSEWGLSTTPQESAELRSSRTRELEAARAERYGHEHPEQFAGLWIDQSRGGVVTVAFTEDLEEHLGALQAQVGADAVRVVDADYSASELAAARLTVEQDFAKVTGVPWSSLSVDVKANRVALGLSYVDDAVAETIRRRYGDLPIC